VYHFALVFLYLLDFPLSISFFSFPCYFCTTCFICQTLIFKTALTMKLFFFPSHKNMSWDEAEKSSLSSSLPHFSLPFMYEVVGEAVLSNNFFKTTQLHLESCSRSCLKKQL